ncbi:hypothetical protein [Pseudonocardia sp. ICBG601]|uniref:hypothetical protein n=1 Tax=Pseudonocardia sp. ICBG601 TaxID=2846759 RepID=UPI001CF66057|nr:hypothetical protein [Pseudonocardia sp. ICBG601]
MTDTSTTSTSTRPDRTAWGAVGVMALTSFVLVLAEFLPPGLLTPMATTLGITEGQAGQAVSATAFVGSSSPRRSARCSRGSTAAPC